MSRDERRLARAIVPLVVILGLVLALLPATPARAQGSVPDDEGSGVVGCSSADGDGDGGYYPGGGCDAARPQPRLDAYPDTPRAGSEVELWASSPGRGLSYAWDLDDDGLYDDGPADAPAYSVAYRFDAPGTRRVRVRVIDEEGREGSADATIEVHADNRAPRGSIATTPASPVAGQSVQVYASGYDTDGAVTRVDYDLDGDGSFERSGTGESVTTSFATAGTRTLRARFTDDAGAATVATATVAVHAGNLAPVASLSSPSRARVEQPVTISSYATDLDGRIAHYEFDLDGDGSYETDTGARGTTSHEFGAAGSHDVGVRVTDDAGATATAWRSIQVTTDDDAPTLNLNVSMGAGGLTGSAYAYDADGSIRQIAWDLDGDEVYEDRVETYDDDLASESDQASREVASAGTYEVGVRVTDDGGEVSTSRRSVAIRAEAPRPPVISVGSTGQPRPGDGVSMWVSPQPDVAYAWDLDDDGQFDDGDGNSVWHSFATAGTHEVSVRARDGLGRVATGRAVATISPAAGNLAPRVSLSAPASARTRATVAVSAWGSDVDGSIAGYAWDLDADGEFDDASGASTSTTFASAGPRLVSVRATDDAGAVAIQRQVVDVHDGNLAPSITISRIDSPGSDAAVVGQSVQLGAYEQIAGDDSIAQYAWDTDEDGQFDDFVDTGYGTYHAVELTTVGTHRVRVRATDQGGATSAATYVLVARAPAENNRAPRASVSGPTVARASTSVSFYGWSPDPDGDPVTMAWDLDDDGDFDDADDALASTTFTGAGDRRVRLRATDSHGASASATWSVTVRDVNVAPLISTFSVNPSPRVGRPTVLSAYASDPE